MFFCCCCFWCLSWFLQVFVVLTVFPPCLSLLPFNPQTYNSTASGGGVTSLPASSQKRLDDNTGRFTNANFQEVSSALSGGASKDGLAADTTKVAAEGKNKKNSSGGAHTVGQRGGRKSLTSSGKPLPSAVVTMATSSTSASASTGPFHQGELIAANVSLC